jgi:hypothetical protein
MSSWRDDLDLEHGTHPAIAHALRALQQRAQWPFPPPTGPVPWTAAQEREHAKQQREQLPEAPL